MRAIPVQRDWSPEDRPIAEENIWKASESEELQEYRASQWARRSAHEPGAEEILVAGACAVCHGKVAREFVLEGNHIVLSPWLHSFATTHKPALEV